MIPRRKDLTSPDFRPRSPRPGPPASIERRPRRCTNLSAWRTRRRVRVSVGRGGGDTLVRMKPKISIVSLAVSDLGRALAFYRDGLGFPTHNYTDGDDFILFRLEGSWLSLMAREEAAKDLPAGALTFSSVGLSHNVPTEAAVR